MAQRKPISQISIRSLMLTDAMRIKQLSGDHHQLPAHNQPYNFLVGLTGNSGRRATSDPPRSILFNANRRHMKSIYAESPSCKSANEKRGI
jgi:hypothetical protein